MADVGTWDAALARTARAWANKCIFKHNVYFSEKHQCHPNFTSIGENIWVGSHQAFCVADAIKLWYNEVRFCVFAMQKHSKACGHYTQVVWDDPYKIGCAVLLCKEVAGIQNAANFVCNYSPSLSYRFHLFTSQDDSLRSWILAGIGIVEAARMMVSALSFSAVIRNPGRDKIISYSRWHPPLEFSFICDEVCISLVVLRESLMFLSSVAVYFIKKHFTNMPMST
ncbi:LOW QUALITY PROTEIN: glioma pathogenesis-related protein 1-like [Strix aluco]|uniref:LOW QUALITY PROTEIN: glioma pathogenesis-related protein 1-like n=1 Tax=Strix aluco TaxID=111821 RepID=UPI003DA3B8EC